jgi:hypothetical protein
VRLADLLLRQGHLSEDALTRAVLSATRPQHLDSCDLCARRALDLGRWLDDIRLDAVQATDDVFPTERLAVQHAQILRRLEQIDEPARVISFPKAPAVATGHPTSGRRVAAAWVGVAAAAGLVIGVIGGQMTARLQITTPAPEQQASGSVAPAAQPTVMADVTVSHPSLNSFLDLDLEGFTPQDLREIDDMTPNPVPGRYTIVPLR